MMTPKQQPLRDVVETSSHTGMTMHRVLLGAILIGTGVAVAALWRGSANEARPRRRASFRDAYRHAPRPAVRPAPVRYDPSIEQVDEDEAETIATLVKLMKGINETTFKNYGRSVRSSHAKSCGLLQGELRVLDGPTFEAKNARTFVNHLRMVAPTADTGNA